MDNIKWGFIAGFAAFIISFFVGLIAGVGLLHVFLRALLFLAVFCGLGFGLRFVISTFLPELLGDDESSPEADDDEYAGKRVNITVGNEYAVPNESDSSGEYELGNLDDLVTGVFKPESGAIDRNIKDEYNYDGVGFQSASPTDDLGFSDFKPFSGNAEEKPVFTPSFAESGLGGLPDLDAMAAVFSGGSAFMPGKEPEEEYTAAEPARSAYSSRNKPQPLKGDFDAKELAKGISTVLSKDNK